MEGPLILSFGFSALRALPAPGYPAPTYGGTIMTNKPLTLVGVIAAAILMMAGARATKAQGVMPCPHEITIGDLFAPPFATSNPLVSGFTCQIDDKIINNFVYPNMGVVTRLPTSSFVQFGTVGGAVAIGFVHDPADPYPHQLSNFLDFNVTVAPNTPPPDNFITSMGLRATGEPTSIIRSMSATTGVYQNPGSKIGNETVHGAFLSDNTTMACTGSTPCATDFFALTGTGAASVRLVNTVGVGSGSDLISVFNFFCEKPNVNGAGACAATMSPGVPPGPGGVLPPPVGVPEPATLGLLVLGLLGVAFAGRKRRNWK
jgi:hypothetical protein